MRKRTIPRPSWLGSSNLFRARQQRESCRGGRGPTSVVVPRASFPSRQPRRAPTVMVLAFREWLVTKPKEGGNLSWPVLVLEVTGRRMVVPGSGENSCATDDHRAAVDDLFSTIETFLRERSQVGGARRIFASYERWLQEQDWYGSSSPLWIPPSK